MAAVPRFDSVEAYRAGRVDAALWAPHIAAILARHGLAAAEPVAGYNPTNPTFVAGDVVIKLFGFRDAWANAHAAEVAAHRILAIDPEILAPRVLAEGRLTDDPAGPWPYLVTERIAGCSWDDAALRGDSRAAAAAELGDQVRRVHALAPPAGAASDRQFAGLDIAAAAEQSSLPPHLVAQAANYIRRVDAAREPADRVFVHGDLCDMHPFVEDGRLTGIIDWGDAMVTDRHYELAQVALNTFHRDKSLLRAFLDGAAWPMREDLPDRAMAAALHRQAVGLTQHLGMDVFHAVPDGVPLDEIATLEELARELFAT